MPRDPPSDVAIYKELAYWNERFAEEDHYEWCKDYSQFRHLLLEIVRPSDRVLEVGCGNSHLSIDMFHDGINQITCSDLSPVAVKRMRERIQAQKCQGVKVVVADMVDLPFEDNSFDVIIEKGTMDVLSINSGDPWKPNVETKKLVSDMLKGIHRVLSPHGVFISISFTQPHFRRLLFEGADYSWSMKWSPFGDNFHYFFYVLKKGTKVNGEMDLHEKDVAHVDIDLVQEHMNGEDYLLRALLDD